MAGDEHRMVFDIRGKRRNVVKFVYAILAVLMGLSLFLVTGAGSLGSLFGGGSSESSGAKISIEQAERIERKLAKSPENPDLLAALTKTRILAGDNSVERNSAGEVGLTTDAIDQYQLASAAWSDYLKATKEPSAGVAILIAPRLVTLAENGNIAEFESNIKAAAEAQQIVAEVRPSINSLSTQAIYEYFSFDYPAAKKVEKEAVALAKTKPEREQVEKGLEPYEKRAKEAQKNINALIAANKGNGSAGKEAIENPLGGLSGGGTLGE
jgi:hypothetical protein